MCSLVDPHLLLNAIKFVFSPLQMLDFLTNGLNDPLEYTYIHLNTNECFDPARPTQPWSTTEPNKVNKHKKCSLNGGGGARREGRGTWRGLSLGLWSLSLRRNLYFSWMSHIRRLSRDSSNEWIDAFIVCNVCRISQFVEIWAGLQGGRAYAMLKISLQLILMYISICVCLHMYVCMCMCVYECTILSGIMIALAASAEQRKKMKNIKKLLDLQ